MSPRIEKTTPVVAMATQLATNKRWRSISLTRTGTSSRPWRHSGRRAFVHGRLHGKRSKSTLSRRMRTRVRIGNAFDNVDASCRALATAADVAPGSSATSTVHAGFLLAAATVCWLSPSSRPPPASLSAVRQRRYLVDPSSRLRGLRTRPSSVSRASKTTRKARSWRCSGRRSRTRSGSARRTGPGWRKGI